MKSIERLGTLLSILVGTKKQIAMIRNELLHENNATQVSLAEDVGVSQPSVNQVIGCNQSSEKIENRYCEIVKHTRKEIWGK